MRRLSWFETFLIVLLFTAGCQTAPRQHEPMAAPLPVVAVPEALTLATPSPLPALPPEPNVPPIVAEFRAGTEQVTNTSAIAQGGPPLPPETTAPTGIPWPKEWVNAWVPLESWGRFNGLGKPSQVTSGSNAVFQLQTSNGLVLLKIGSHMAHVGGLEFGLGFAPRLIRGLPYVHSLDAQKTLQVLLSALLPWPSGERVIVIDPGHGGRDSGTRSIVGREYEKDFTLDWALRLQRHLAASHCKVILTRTNDIDVPLADRVQIADRAGADLFVSLHLNSGGSNHELAGIETYCLTPTGMPSNLVRGYDDDLHENHPNNHFDDQNVRLASRVHRSLLQATSGVDRGVRRARFMAVLRGQNRPAILIEGGYLSNAGEARRLANPEYRETLAEAVAKALLE